MRIFLSFNTRDVGYEVRHQAADEMHVAAQPIELGDHDRALGAAFSAAASWGRPSINFLERRTSQGPPQNRVAPRGSAQQVRKRFPPVNERQRSRDATVATSFWGFMLQLEPLN